MALRLSGDGNITGINSLNTDVSSTELGYLDGVSSALQSQVNSKASLSGATFTGGIYYDSGNIGGSGGLNITNSETKTDTSTISFTGFQNKCGVIIISNNGQITHIPFFANGGNGIAYRWTVLDPDTGWNANWNGSFSFSQAGSGSHAFTIGFAGGNGTITIARSGGSGTYSAYISTLYSG